jgi:hypothetical protein
VIAVDPAVADRVREVLASLEPSELAPGVFVVGGDTPLDTIHARLRRADVSSCARLVPFDSQAQVPVGSIQRGSPELRDRIAAWRNRPGRDRADEPRPRVAAAPPGAAAAPGAALARDPPLAWVREEIGPRLQRIAGEAPLALDLGSSIVSIHFSRLLQRGDTWMALGEEIDTGEAMAVPLPKVTGFAMLDRIAAAPDPEPGPRGRAVVPAAAPNLPGHVRCPCGSGARYRNCCRP